MKLGERLKKARSAKGLTLRDVERQTRISNGYLSLLESGTVKQPSPHHLYQLSNVYGVSYAELIDLAGYVIPRRDSADAADVQTRAYALSAQGLTEEQLRSVENYIAFLRSQSEGKDQI